MWEGARLREEKNGGGVKGVSRGAVVVQ